MKVVSRILAVILTISLVLAVSCSDRGTNGSDDYTRLEGGPLVKSHVFFDEFIVQIKNQFQLLEMAAYVPRVSYPAVSGGELRPVPLLILLPPKGKDQYFYFNHGLQQLADELISTGQIQPMVVVCISNDLVFGGYFYGSRYPGAGDYDALVGGSLVDFIYTGYTPFAINSADKRAIGGVGQGAYGAFRAAILHPGTFCSISAVDGPLDFDGPSGNGGFIELFDDALVEQDLLGRQPAPPTYQDRFWVCDSTDLLGECVDSSEVEPGLPYDFSTIDTLWPPSWRDLFDSTTDLSQTLIGASLAFSPHDTSVHCTTIVSQDGRNMQIRILSRETIADTVTLIPQVVNADARNFDFHLPFDSTGAIYHPIWDNYWLPNNLENLLAGSPDALDNINIWIATSEEARFMYHEQTDSWISTMRNTYGLPVSTMTYEGYSGNPATGDQYVYDLLKDMLIFHSECFGE